MTENNSANATSGGKMNTLFNLGVKTPDSAAEEAFFAAFNPDRKFFLDRSYAKTGPKKVPAIELGQVKFFFFETLAYDEDLPAPQAGGISHVAFMVDSVDKVVENLRQKGYEPLRGPYTVDNGDLGHRKVVFFRSPNGLIIEPQELVQ
ncbi:MAG: VOC family protein [Mesorhizobium sp.]|nr:VOC family protein [Mesorhizobium sp.]